MDPSETLRLIRLTIKQMQVDEHDAIYKAHAKELIQYFGILDAWMSAGGFKPGQWTK